MEKSVVFYDSFLTTVKAKKFGFYSWADQTGSMFLMIRRHQCDVSAHLQLDEDLLTSHAPPACIEILLWFRTATID